MNSDILVIDSLTITWFLEELIKNYLDKGDSNTLHHHLANGLQDFKTLLPRTADRNQYSSSQYVKICQLNCHWNIKLMNYEKKGTDKME